MARLFQPYQYEPEDRDNPMTDSDPPDDDPEDDPRLGNTIDIIDSGYVVYNIYGNTNRQVAYPIIA